MNIISQMIAQRVAGAAAGQLASRLGISEGTAQTAVQLAVPLLVEALARNASQPGGADALHEAVTRDHDGGILDNILGHFADPSAANGAGILSHVLGDRQPAVANNLAQATGLDQGTAGSVLEAVAPLVMGAVGREQREQGLDPSGLAQFLGGQQQAQAAQPGMMGMLSSMLDSNNDGSVMDDIGRLAGGFFKQG
ncbi:MAG TPA: DUF937 domain-containing protein [Pyrinomonadaceae bacterium]|jgi:hypothetical protein|nr:DUF937 domain-containing protein [Pyrinomonadaceae bacterium]